MADERFKGLTTAQINQRREDILKRAAMPPRGLTARSLSSTPDYAPPRTVLTTPKTPLDVEWQFWKMMPKVALWEACALVVGVDPDKLKPPEESWMNGPDAAPIFDTKSFSTNKVAERFKKALRLTLNSARDVDSPIFLKGQQQSHFDIETNVLLSDVVTFFKSCEWPDIPEPLQTLSATVKTLKPHETPILVTSPSDLKPWLEIDPRDPTPEQPWYAPARYFARQLVLKDSTLLTKKLTLADKVSQSLYSVRIYKRGRNKQRLAADTVLKAFSNVALG